ncbi:GATA zinc finger domain-containing protein 10 isoform X1 [Drosophila teissieri]|uniref:GATA zinc finger domain-containing protein 10 isoform X1 n=1 Tax=Drosophila teissieri TaxID=7243 RepID=UPI001CBA050A|nr:GATA zinc finger domain-containing protein 10 isoform X1 [Drosophila teissieri]
MSKFAWVTLTTNDTYSLGALVLAHSLKRAKTAHQLAVLVTPNVSQAMRDRLTEVYNVVQEVNVLDSQDAANLALLSRPELGVTFTKLHCWRLVQFEKCVFLDADTLVLQNCDELFEREELSAAPDVSWPDCFNSGVFVFKPSVDTFAQITEFAVKNGSFDGGDQGLLNQFFADWSTADIKKHLPFVYNVTAYASYCYLPAFKQFRDKIKILHFAGKLKPWLIQFNSETKVASVSSEYAHAQDLIQLWWNIFCENVIQSLSTEMCLCLNIIRTQSEFAADELHQRQQHEFYQQQQLHHQLLHVRQFRDPWADYYENLEKELQEQEQRMQQQHQQQQHHNPSQNHSQDNGNADATAIATANEIENENDSTIANANANANATEWHHDNACHPPPSTSPSPQTQNQAHNANATANAEGFSSIDVNSNELNISHPPEHASSSSDTATPTPTPTANATPSQTPTPTPHHSVHSQTVEKATNHQQEHEVAATTPAEAGLAGALSQLRIGQQRTPEQEAYENQMRRQCWESGQIDYSGADSFENIWKKISQTLERKTEKESEETDNDSDSDPANPLSTAQLLNEAASMLLHPPEKSPTSKAMKANGSTGNGSHLDQSLLTSPATNKQPANASASSTASLKQSPQKRQERPHPQPEAELELEPRPQPQPQPQPTQQHIRMQPGGGNGSVSKSGKQRSARKFK